MDRKGSGIDGCPSVCMLIAQMHLSWPGLPWLVVCSKVMRIHHIESDHLCYIYLASCPSPSDLSPESPYLVPQVVQACTKVLCKRCSTTSKKLGNNEF